MRAIHWGVHELELGKASRAQHAYVRRRILAPPPLSWPTVHLLRLAAARGLARCASASVTRKRKLKPKPKPKLQRKRKLKPKQSKLAH